MESNLSFFPILQKAVTPLDQHIGSRADWGPPKTTQTTRFPSRLCAESHKLFFYYCIYSPIVYIYIKKRDVTCYQVVGALPSTIPKSKRIKYNIYRSSASEKNLYFRLVTSRGFCHFLYSGIFLYDYFHSFGTDSIDGEIQLHDDCHICTHSYFYY